MLKEVGVEKFARAVIRQRRLVVAAFVVVMLVCAALIPLVRVNYNMVDYLPESAQSTKAVEIMAEEFDQATPNCSVLVRDVDLPKALEVKEHISRVEGVDAVMWLDDVQDLEQPLEMADETLVETYYRGGAALYSVTVAEGEEGAAIPALRDLVDGLGAENAVSGEAMDTAQMQISMVNQVFGAVAIVVPAIILLLVLSTTSWIEPVLFLAAIGVSILINMGTNIVFGEVSFVTFSVSPILQLAVSLDYAIFLLHTFADERARQATVEDAMVVAMRRSASTIAASATTTLFGFAALAFMQFQIGADLGINLVKGIVFSFVTVMVLLPALTMLLYRLIDRTSHRRLMPTFANVGSVLSKVRIPVLALAVLLAVPAFLGQSHVTFTYQNNVADPHLRAGADTMAVEEAFGKQNPMVVLVPRGDVAAEAALSDELAGMDFVTSVMSYPATVGAAIPSGFLDESVVSQFYSPNWARIVAYLDTDVESEEAFAAVQAVQDAAARHYDEYYTAGTSANLYDMKNIVSVDNVVVSAVAVVAILGVLLATFRSLMLPLVLLFTIEVGIWINLSIPYFAGDRVNFIGYLVVNTVQLGATIDYAILLTTRYLEQRRLKLPRQAVHAALGESFRSLVVSAGILAIAGFALAASSSISAVSSLGFLLGRGALLSLLLVTCLLPALLVLFDGAIRRTTWKADFKGGSS